MKLSGAFSEIIDQSPTNVLPVNDLVEHIRPWVDHVFDQFGCWRIMFGSDWPVCNVRGPGDAKSWGHWVESVDKIMRSREMSEMEMNRVWYGTAAEAYRLDPIR
jgi:L-rhamnono-1,4-lactonase